MVGLKYFIQSNSVPEMKSVAGNTFNPQLLVEKLIQTGYTRDTIVNKTGEYAVRGFIIDVFPIESDYPVRIEFFDDEIDSIRYFGDTWCLLYDPADPMSIAPNLQGCVIQGQTCTPVKLPGNDQSFFLVVIDIEIPSSFNGTEMTPAKYLKGIRIFDRQPVSLATLQVQDLLYYVKKPILSQTGGTAQQFLNTILGKSLTENQKKTNADKSWSRTMFEGVKSEQGTAKASNRASRPNTEQVPNLDGPSDDSY